MIDRLRQILAYIKQLDAKSQDIIAATLEAKLAEIAEARWQDLFADPHSHAFFDELVTQAEAARANGTLLDLDDLLKTVV